MSVFSHPLPAAASSAARDVALFGFGFGCAYAFAIPYLGVSVLDLQHDVYYAAYFAAVLLLLGAYVRVEHIDPRALLLPRWRWSVGIGVLVAIFFVFNVLRSEAAGNVLISLPAFATANPVGSIVAHVSQHVAAVTHAYESKIFNPPTTTA